jgi:hypothetical protein
MVDSVLYFAYGHNANVSEFLKRIPQARLIGRATAHGFKLYMEHFTDIRPDKKSSIAGVLWAVPTDKIPLLDFDEDHRDHYHHIRLNVNFNGKTYRAFAYQMYQSYHNVKVPTRKYIDFIANAL